MRRTFFLAAVALVLAALPVALAQDERDPIVAGAGAKIPDSLENLLEAALENNPDVLLAEAGVRQAQAVLNQTRLDVAQRAAGLFHERKKLLTIKADLAAAYRSAKLGFDAGHTPETEMRHVALAQAESHAKLAQVEAEIRYALGVGGNPRTMISLSFTRGAAPIQAPPKTLPRPRLEDAQGYRKLLEAMKVDWEAVPLGAVLEQLQEAADGDLAFVLHSTIDPDDYEITLRLPGEVTLKRVLAALADYLQGEVCFVFREYGVLATDWESAERLEGPTIPEGTPLRPASER